MYVYSTNHLDYTDLNKSILFNEKKLLLESHQYFLPDPRLNVADNYDLRYLKLFRNHRNHSFVNA